MNKHRPRGRERAALFAATTVTVLSGASFIATAQQPPAASPASLEEVTVTGTRIRRDDFSTPTPTTVVDDSFMDSLRHQQRRRQVVTGSIPLNVSFFQPSNTGGSPFFVGSTLGQPARVEPLLRHHEPLTLVDSKRHVPTNNGSSVDLNAIPSLMVDRMEIVTGGASAAYGSDAISGVVNILIESDARGSQARSRGRQLRRRRRQLSLRCRGRHGVFDGRGHIVAGAEYRNRIRFECAHEREWCAQSVGTFSNGGFPGAPVGTTYFQTVPKLPQTVFSPIDASISRASPA